MFRDSYLKDLLFFDKEGTSYAFDFDKETNMYEGSIYITPVSKGLFETQKIIMMQKYALLDESNEVDYDTNELIAPASTYDFGYMSRDDNGNLLRYKFKWDDDVREVDEIRLFGFDAAACPPEDTNALTYFEYNCPQITYYDEVVIEGGATFTNPTTGETLGILHDRSDVVGYSADQLVNKPYWVRYDKRSFWESRYSEINISFCNADDVYQTFRRDLYLYAEYLDDDNTVKEQRIGIFRVYAQSIEEDERLTTMCHNLGYDINNSDFQLFKDADIKEQLADYELINEKRKEVLMEGSNIYPYVGTYKSLINAIRFFGYDNISIKEWWRNVDTGSVNYGKYFLATSYSLTEKEVIKSDSNTTLPSRNYRKTSKITLTWKINDIQRNEERDVLDEPNSYTGHEYPMTKEVYDYTIEEAVIKLYGLKRKLEKEFLPLHTHIVDIVGEADAFNVMTVSETPSSTISNTLQAGNPVDFEVVGGDTFYIEDLRPFGLFNVSGDVSGNGMVGETHTGSPGYIGGGLMSFYSVFQNQQLQGLNELGVQGLQQYNTNWVADGLQTPYTIQMTTDLQGIQGIWGYGADSCQGLQGHGTIQDLQGYNGYQGAVPPYSMWGDNLFGVYGDTLDECIPWEYYRYYIDSNGCRGNYYLANFSNYYPNLVHNSMPANAFDEDQSRYLPDNEEIPVGALVRLKFIKPEVAWNDMEYSWNYFGKHPIYDSDNNVIGYECDISWNLLPSYVRNFCRIEWIVYKEETDTPEFIFQIGGTVEKGYDDVGIVLPYVGSYSIELKVFDWNNDVSVKYRTDCITVEPKQVEFNGWCKMKVDEFTWGSDCAWDDVTSTWDFPINNGIRLSDLNVSFDSLDRGTFLGEYIDTDDVDEGMNFYNFESVYDENIGDWVMDMRHSGAYFWNNLDCSWEDLSHLWYEATIITGDIPCYFDFGFFDEYGNAVSDDNGNTLWGNYLEIVTADRRYGQYRFPAGNTSALTDLTFLVHELNASTDPVISRFAYSQVYDYDSTHWNTNPNIPSGFKICAVAKTMGRNGDLKTVHVCDAAHHAYVDANNNLHIVNDENNHLTRFKTNSVCCNPNWEDVVSINNVRRVPRYTDVNFNYSNCRINGKKNPRWRITNNNNPETTMVSTRKHFHYMFKERGCYEISLTLEDTNGNTYEARRNTLIIE